MPARTLATFTAALLAVMAYAGIARAQGTPLSPGTVSAVALYNPHNGQPLGTCPADFWSASAPKNPAVCYTAAMTCANTITTPSLAFTFSYDNPSTSPKGVVVLFSGASGTNGTVPNNVTFAKDYFDANYEIVEVGWNTTDWEQTTDPLGILTAACRPAGFLAYALTNPLLNPRLNANNPHAGFCAQGTSAGSGAIGYAITWYQDVQGGGGNYLSSDLDDVELISGPVFSNIQIGCQVTGGNVAAVPICYPGQQYGCSTGTTGWSDSPLYVADDSVHVGLWTNDTSCGGTTVTSSTSNQKWLSMSIVNGSGGNFSYLNLGLGGWLCATSTKNCDVGECPNNSAAEGEQFYSQFTGPSQTKAFRLTGILDCYGPENIEAGQDPDQTGLLGKPAVEQRMEALCTH